MAIQAPLLTAVEYFAGIGLVRMGIEAAGWRVLFANDFAKSKFEMYEGFYPDARYHYVVEDIYNLDIFAIPTSTLATCSFPCIDLSLAGNRSGIHGQHSSAFWGFTAILEAQGDSAPPLLLLENVPGWLTSNDGNDFRITVESLNRLGYACDVLNLDALRFTPQSRTRIFLIATKFDVDAGSILDMLHRPKSLASDRLKQTVLNNQDLNWFFNPLPEPPVLRQHGLAEIVEKLDPSDERWWTDEEVQRHLDMMDTPHRARITALVDQPNYAYRTFFRRRRKGFQRAEVRNDDVAGCLRTVGGGSGKQFLIQVGQGAVRMRAMTPREYARLQGVPDEYRIKGTTVQALTGFGDAVCVPAITWIAENLLTPLARRFISESLEKSSAD
jgi:DNA (cytosine-5)-methyltransferase 1